MPASSTTSVAPAASRNGAAAGRSDLRFAKLFVRENLDGLVPGLHVEAWAYPSVTKSVPDDEALAAILHAGAQALQPYATYADPTGDDELSRRLDPVVRDQARIAFDKAAAQAAEAVALRRGGSDNAAIALWHELLGADFPKPSTGEALASLGAGAGVSAAGAVSSGAAVRPTPTRSWRP